VALDPTSREANFRNSLKKYLVDNLVTVESLTVTFDASLASPDLQDTSVTEWIQVHIGPMDPDNLMKADVIFVPCTREDAEGYRLAQLRDIVVGYLRGNGGGMISIPFYNTGVTPWVKVGGMVPILEPDSREFTATDGTKFKFINVRMAWGARI
jgi:hypothetical protein